MQYKKIVQKKRHQQELHPTCFIDAKPKNPKHFKLGLTM